MSLLILVQALECIDDAGSWPILQPHSITKHAKAVRTIWSAPKTTLATGRLVLVMSSTSQQVHTQLGRVGEGRDRRTRCLQALANARERIMGSQNQSRRLAPGQPGSLGRLSRCTNMQTPSCWLIRNSDNSNPVIVYSDDTPDVPRRKRLYHPDLANLLCAMRSATCLAGPRSPRRQRFSSAEPVWRRQVLWRRKKRVTPLTGMVLQMGAIVDARDPGRG